VDGRGSDHTGGRGVAALPRCTLAYRYPPFDCGREASLGDERQGQPLSRPASSQREREPAQRIDDRCPLEVTAADWVEAGIPDETFHCLAIGIIGPAVEEVRRSSADVGILQRCHGQAVEGSEAPARGTRRLDAGEAVADGRFG